MKKIISSLLFRPIFFLSSVAIAQEAPIPPRTDVQILTEPRNLLSLKIVSGEPIKIYVLGVKKAELDLRALYYDVDFNSSDLSLTIHRAGPQKMPRILKIESKNDHFIIEGPMKIEKDSVLELKMKTKDKKETFKFKVKQDLL